MDLDSKSIHVSIRLPEGYRFLEDRNHYLMLGSTNKEVLAPTAVPIEDLDFDWEVPVDVRGEGETELEIKGMVYFCPVEDAYVCIYSRTEERVPVRVEAGSGGRVELVHTIEEMEVSPGGYMTKGTQS